MRGGNPGSPVLHCDPARSHSMNGGWTQRRKLATVPRAPCWPQAELAVLSSSGSENSFPHLVTNIPRCYNKEYFAVMKPLHTPQTSPNRGLLPLITPQRAGSHGGAVSHCMEGPWGHMARW